LGLLKKEAGASCECSARDNDHARGQHLCGIAIAGTEAVVRGESGLPLTQPFNSNLLKKVKRFSKSVVQRAPNSSSRLEARDGKPESFCMRLLQMLEIQRLLKNLSCRN
jgi:hypothetical protein